MKQKNNITALVGIVIGAMLLSSLASPATAVYGYVGTDLDIFGNANEDGTIDMRDTTYIKLVIFGKKPETDLADANCDGKISMLDVGQTKLIILGKEKTLSTIDRDGETVTVHKPLKRVIATYYTSGETIRTIGATDRVVGMGGDTIYKNPTFFPELSKKPNVGKDIETILDLKPDVVFASSRRWWPELEEQLKGTGIDVVYMYPYDPESLRSRVMVYGYLFDERENARKYFEWSDKYLEMITERVSGIPENKKTTVIIEDPGGTSGSRKITGHLTTATVAGGKDLAADISDLPTEQRLVDVEWIIEQNPDVYIEATFYGEYETDDVSPLRYDEILGVPGFEHIKAVQDDRVYIMNCRFGMGQKIPIGTAYMAKWFYPKLFEDLDPQKMHQEYVDTFCPGLDFDVSEHGVFVYHPKEYPEGH